MSQHPSAKPLFSELVLEAVKKIQAPLLLYGIVESVIIVSVVILGHDIPNNRLPLAYGLIGVILFIALGHLMLEYCKMRRADPPIVDSSPPPLFVNSESLEFRNIIEGLIRNSERLILIGTGLTILHRDSFLLEVMDKVTNGNGRMEIYLADPLSPAVELRLIEEELGSLNPPVGRPGLNQRLDTILRAWVDRGRPDAITLRLFTHYPTFALLIVDRNYFIYPYGYAQLGNFSPVFRFSKEDPSPGGQAVIAFLDQHYKRVKESALDMDTLLKIRKQRPVAVEKLLPIAVYFIPPEDSPLYQFGTHVLGYDIRKGSPVATEWQDQVGSAHNFGFHMTLCDALYFLNPIQIIEAEVNLKYLAKDFKPFDITNLRFNLGFPDAKSVSLALNDISGSLEALHFELVQRIYRNAVGSLYTQKQTEPVRDKNLERARLMMSRYQAPYILQNFQPHFTLLTNIPPEEQLLAQEKLKALWNNLGCKETIRVEQLAILTRPKPDAPWVIKQEIDLI